MNDTPPHLEVALSLLESYLDRRPSGPFLALGSFGVGRGHGIDVTLRRHGLEPFWLSEAAHAPDIDLEGRRLFPVYDLSKPEIPPTTPSIVLASPDARREKEFRDLEFGIFPEVPIDERERFLTALGAPVALADGNPTYPSLRNAALAYAVSGGVQVRTGPHETPDWDLYRHGGELPVPEGLLAYYAAYALPPGQWWPNRNLGAQRKLRARSFRILTEQIRLEWPEGTIPFPEILKEPSKPKERRPRNAPPTNGTAPPPKGYEIEWD